MIGVVNFCSKQFTLFFSEEPMSDTKITVMYHKNCIDGLMSAVNYYAMYKEKDLLSSVTFLPVQYGEPLPPLELIKDRVVIVLDFSFSYAQTQEIIKICKQFSMLDHHQSAIDNLMQEGLFPDALFNSAAIVQCTHLVAGANYRILIDKDKSGATLAYYSVLSSIANVQTLAALKYLSVRVADRDLWKFEFHDSKAVHEFLSHIRGDVGRVYDTIFKTVQTPMQEINDWVNWADVRVTFREELAMNYAKKAVVVPFMGYDTPVVNVASDFASLVGDFLGKENPLAAMYVVTNDKVLVSLRSNQATGVNVKEIAAKFGGGGHDHAAGFSIPHDMIGVLVKGELSPCHPYFDKLKEGANVR